MSVDILTRLHCKIYGILLGKLFKYSSCSGSVKTILLKSTEQLIKTVEPSVPFIVIPYLHTCLHYQPASAQYKTDLSA